MSGSDAGWRSGTSGVLTRGPLVNTEGMHMETEVREELETLKRDQAVMAAEFSGAQATQAATQAGQAATQAATQAGTWSTMLAGAIGMVTGIFLTLATVATRKK